MAYGTNAPFGLRPISSQLGGTWTGKTSEYYISSTIQGGATIGYANSIFQGDPVQANTSNTAPVGNAGGYLATSGTIAVYNPGFVDGTPSAFAQTALLGVFWGCEYRSAVTGTNNLIQSNYWPGGAQVMPGSLIKAFVIDDPMVLYDVQMSTFINANANAFHGLAPVLPVHNPAGNNAATEMSGNFYSNFALNIGGGTNFDTVHINGAAAGYNNNPTGGNTLTGQSAFYLDVAHPTGGVLTHDYHKDVATLPFKAMFYTRDPRNIGRRNPVEFAGTYTKELTPFLNVTGIINHGMFKPGSPGVVFA